MFYFSIDDPLIGVNAVDEPSIISNPMYVMATTKYGGHLACFPDLTDG